MQIMLKLVRIHTKYGKERAKLIGSNRFQNFFQGQSHLTVALLVSFDVDVPPYFFKSQSTPIKSTFRAHLARITLSNV